MRGGLTIALLVAGCGTDYYVDLSPRFDRAVGVDLTVDVYADVIACRVDGFDEEICSNDQTDGLDIAVDGTSAVLGPAASLYSDVTLTGVAPGAPTLSIEGDRAGLEVPVSVRPVASSTLYVERWGGVSALPPEYGPVAAFTDASLLLRQTHKDATGAPLLGEAPWIVDAGPTGSAYDDYDVLAVGPTVGRATVATAVGGELEIDVVDGSAIDAIDIHQPFSDDPLDRLELPVGAHVSVYLRAYDATGRTITGWGPRPTWTVTPLLATLDYEERYGDAREIVIDTLEAGTAVAQIAWGPRTVELTIVIR